MASKTKIEKAVQFEKKENSKKKLKKISEGTAGLEPAIFCSVGRRVIRCATHPSLPKRVEFRQQFFPARKSLNLTLNSSKFIKTYSVGLQVAREQTICSLSSRAPVIIMWRENGCISSCSKRRQPTHPQFIVLLGIMYSN